MPAKNDDLHGNAPDKSPVALVIIDMINDFEFEGGCAALDQARPIAPAIAALKQRAKALRIPVVYANDNFGRWRSDFREVVEHCLNDGVKGEEIVAQLKPQNDEYFVLKPKHSAFYSTSLDILLNYLQAKTLILTGISGDICVRFTANDAYMRDYRIFVPRDCVSSLSSEENEQALAFMQRVTKADTRPSTELELKILLSQESAEDDGR